MAIINTIQQVNDTLSALTQEVDFTVGTFSKKMSSDEANNVFLRFSAIINKLYEKARYLQDLREYTEAYIDSECHDKHQKLKAVTDSIEKTESQYQKEKQVVHDILLTSEHNYDSLLDFDGNVIGSAYLMSGDTLTSGHNEVYSYSLTQNTDIKHVSDQNGTFLCSVGFKTQKDMISINYIEAVTSNCSIKSIDIETTGKDKYSLNQGTSVFIDTQAISTINVDIEMTSGQIENKNKSEINSLSFV